VINSRRIHGDMEPDLEVVRADLARRGLPVEGMSDDDLLNMVEMFGEMFRENAPVSAAQAATVILDGVRAGRWRILIGDDARVLDEVVRADPEAAYGPEGPDLSTITGAVSPPT
jgi:hypothetical protein